MITALYRGQLFEKLRLAEKRITSRDVVTDSDADVIDAAPNEYTVQENIDIDTETVLVEYSDI